MLNYKIKKSARAKRVRIKVGVAGEVVVVLPKSVPKFFARAFVASNRRWIERQQAKMGARRAERDARLLDHSRARYLKHKQEAQAFCQKRVQFWAKKMHIQYHKITIKNTRTRWGSASSKGNLNFNYKIIFLPDDLADYLIVHELAHLREMNHSEKFWSIVSRYIPDCKEKRKRLKDFI